MHYMLAYRKDQNCPIFIDGVIHESFYPGAYDQDMNGEWHYAGPGKPKAPLPEKLTLITKDKKYEFDLKTDFEGHIVSERLWFAIKTIKTGNWEAAKLGIVSPKGIPCESGQYYFIRQQDTDQLPIDAIDLEKSAVNFRKTGEIKNITSLILKNEIDLDFFCIDEISVLGKIFISSNAADTFNQLKLKGVEIVSTEKLGAVKSA